MEKLKSVVPGDLKQQISESSPDDLPSTCSSLLDFFNQLPQFHQMLRHLIDPEMALCRKNKDSAMESKRQGNDCFVKGDYPKALRFYSQALRAAPADADDKDKNLVAVLYKNRASVFHKMVLFAECLRDCNRAIAISPSYAKVWYWRGKANASLGNHEDAVRDLMVSMAMESFSGGKRQIENELKLILDHHNGTSSLPKNTNVDKLDVLDELHQKSLQCVSTPTKGRGMVSLADIPQASLIHTEEPYAAIILKHCRETHCHFCLNELPADTLPCLSCSTPLYCSQPCQLQAGGRKWENDPKNCGLDINISSDLERYVADITSASTSGSYTASDAEHRHECEGVNWPAVLPSDVVLAGRVLVKSVKKQKNFDDVPSINRNLDLCHNYVQLPSESKLELHIYSIILLYCLQHSSGSNFEINGLTISQCVTLLSQIRVNSMGIVRMKYFDVNGLLDQSGKYSSVGIKSTTTVEQVKVGQALYLAGSLFNHSCCPNIHAYFLSRTVYMQSTESVAAGHPLELSYGPQVGQWDFKDRQRLLEDQYSFKCQCRGCSELNLSDLLLNAFRCINSNCSGLVLDSYVAEYEKSRVKNIRDVPELCSSGPWTLVGKLINDISEVARHELEQNSCAHHMEPGYCLNCGSFRDPRASVVAVNKAGIYIRRLEDAIGSNQVSTSAISDALSSLDLLRSILHAYNKKIAEVEDIIAWAFCLVGDLESARVHCKASIEILEKLYGPSHIVIANELVKLSSIQLSLADSAAVDSISRVVAIFLQYYGSHADIIFPHLQCLKQEAYKLG